MRRPTFVALLVTAVLVAGVGVAVGVALSSGAPDSSPTTTTASGTPTAGSPATTTAGSTTQVAINGQLHVCGTHLCNQDDKPIQLRGTSTHGLQWFSQCYTSTALDTLADDWHADVLRLAMYVDADGYVTNPDGLTTRVENLVDETERRGMYAIVDFHTLDPGDPNLHTQDAKTFFGEVAPRFADKKNVIYEITNEPNGVSWQQIHTYADQVIPVIRAADPDAVIVVGTRGWSSLGVSDGATSAEIVADPIDDPNVMYTFHFYAASHGDQYRNEVRRAAATLPIFVTEFGTVTYSGDGTVDLTSTTTWLDLLDELKISYVNWTFSDADETSAALKRGSCTSSRFGPDQLSQSGQYIRARISTPDDFPTS